MFRWRFLTLPVLLIVLITCVSIAYWIEIPQVPFHPDESTYLYMSSDFETFFQNPQALFWQPGPADPLTHYRLVDPGLTRLIIGLGRFISAHPALPVDWDWSKTWEENQQAGALPAPGLLMAARQALAVFFPLSLLFLFLAARRFTSETGAWIAVVLLASNALVLLHTRRIMAEAVLLAAVCACCWGLFLPSARRWWLALPVGLAIGAKYSVMPLALVGFIAVLWPPQAQPRSVREWARAVLPQAVVYCLGVLLITACLNPVFWAHPIQAIPAAITEREKLVSEQTAVFRSLMPSIAPTSLAERTANLIAHLYFAPPQTSDTANYLKNTQELEQLYQSAPWHRLFRSLGAGGLLLFLSLFGWMISWAQVLQKKPVSPFFFRSLSLLSLLLLLTSGLLIVFPFLFQRYLIPLLPPLCICIAAGLEHLFRPAFRRLYHR